MKWRQWWDEFLQRLWIPCWLAQFIYLAFLCVLAVALLPRALWNRIRKWFR